MNGVLQDAGLELFLVVDDDHRILVEALVLEAGLSDGSLSIFSILPKSV